MSETYSVSFSTTRLGTICTGYRLTMAGKGAMKSGIKGVDGGVLIAKGTTLRRDYEAETLTYGDPIYQELSGSIVIAPNNSSAPGGGLNVLTEEEARELFYSTIMQGDPLGFLKRLIPGANITMGTPSAAMDSLGGNGSPNANEKTISQINDMFGVGQIITVQDTLQTFLPILGVELYWDGDDRYILEAPRILTPKSKGTIIREDIIEKTIGSDVFNVPDVIIPRFPPTPIMTKRNWDTAMVEGLQNVSGAIRGNKKVKITVFDIPSVHSGALLDGLQAFRNSKTLTTGVLHWKNPSTTNRVLSFFTGLAFSSAMYGIASGTVVCRFQPNISIPASWYEVDGELLFISDIRHEVSRFRAVTILTVAGTEETLKGLPAGSVGGGGGGGSPDTKLSEAIAKVKRNDSKAKDKKKEVLREKKIHHKKNTSSGISSGIKIKMGRILPDDKTEKAKLSGSVIEVRVAK